MSQLYFDNDQSPNVNLRKAEILMYYGKNGNIYYKPINFPGVPESNVLKPKETTNEIIISGISDIFYPISMTMWGKIYTENTNSFKMVELNDNTFNITSFQVNNDKISMSIKTGPTMNIINLGATDNNRLLSKSTDANPVLISKIIILYDEILPDETKKEKKQSMIKKTSTAEPYRYIGIM